MSIRLLLAGGTIDKHYNASNGDLDFADSHIEAALLQGRCTAEVVVQQVLLKDSLDMTAEDREALEAACRVNAEQRIVITHGTDTMVETAALLAAANLEKTVVLTGAMIPFIMKDSDGLFNLGCALTAAQCLPAGVYIAINGEVFEAGKVRKNYEDLKFEALED
ncbi:MAG: asparaginase domain-containing protein [Thiolinea sp.]